MTYEYRVFIVHDGEESTFSHFSSEKLWDGAAVRVSKPGDELDGQSVSVYRAISHPTEHGPGIALGRKQSRRTDQPNVVAAMEEVGVDVSDEFPKPITDEVVRAADVVVTMGCGDACPVYTGKTYRDWEVEGPARQDPRQRPSGQGRDSRARRCTDRRARRLRSR